MFFISLQKHFSFSWKSNFRILDIQILWLRQLPKHKTKNTFHWIILGSKHRLLMRFDQFMPYYERIDFLSKSSTKTAVWKLVSGPFCLPRNKHRFYWKMTFLKQAIDMRYVLAKLSKFVQISIQTSADSFLKKIPWKLKRSWN